MAYRNNLQDNNEWLESILKAIESLPKYGAYVYGTEEIVAGSPSDEPEGTLHFVIV